MTWSPISSRESERGSNQPSGTRLQQGASTVDAKTDSSPRLFLAMCAITFGTLAFGMMSAWVWLLKDGLGPDAIESHGWVALKRFLVGAGWPLLIPTTSIFAGLWLLRSERRRYASESAS